MASYADRKKERERQRKEDRQLRKQSELRWLAMQRLPPVPKKKRKVVEVDEIDWGFGGSDNLAAFQKRLDADVRAARKKGANKFYICYERFRIEADGPETDQQFEDRKAAARKERKRIEKARAKVAQQDKEEAEALQEARQLLVQATKDFTVREFNQLVSDVLRGLKRCH